MTYLHMMRSILIGIPLYVYGAENSVNKENIAACRHTLRIIIKMRTEQHKQRTLIFDAARSPKTATYTPLSEDVQKILTQRRLSHLMK